MSLHYSRKQTVMDLTDTLTCLDLFELHLRLTHHYVTVGLTPERHHGSGCQGNLRGLHYCPLLWRLQYLNNNIEYNSIITTNESFTTIINHAYFVFKYLFIYELIFITIIIDYVHMLLHFFQ